MVTACSHGGFRESATVAYWTGLRGIVSVSRGWGVECGLRPSKEKAFSCRRVMRVSTDREKPFPVSNSVAQRVPRCLRRSRKPWTDRPSRFRAVRCFRLTSFGRGPGRPGFLSGAEGRNQDHRNQPVRPQPSHHAPGSQKPDLQRSHPARPTKPPLHDHRPADTAAGGSLPAAGCGAKLIDSSSAAALKPTNLLRHLQNSVGSGARSPARHGSWSDWQRILVGEAVCPAFRGTG